MLKFTKPQLDALGTVCGLIAGICGVLTVQEVGNPKIIGTVGGVATVVLGYVVQHPAKRHPTTEEVEPPPDPPAAPPQRPTTLY